MPMSSFGLALDRMPAAILTTFKHSSDFNLFPLLPSAPLDLDLNIIEP
jgi:hypothetical protein